jgi:hypothetical protein
MSPSLSDETIVVASPDQVSAEVAGDPVILGLRDGRYYGLSGAGSRLWQLVAEPRSITEIVDLLVAEYDVDRATCRDDVLRLVDDLARRRLVIRKPSERA